MKTLRILGLAILTAAPAHAAAPRHYRWAPQKWNALPYLFSAAIDAAFDGDAGREKAPPTVGLGGLKPGQNLLRAGTEFVESGVQKLGPAELEGSWTQTIFRADGQALYAAGAVFDEKPGPEWLPRLEALAAELPTIKRIAENISADYRRSPRRSEPVLKLRPREKGWEAFWRLEFTSLNEDRGLFLELSEHGGLLAAGDLHAPAADGKGLVYPQGPKLSDLTEVALHNLPGDGTLNGPKLRVESALGLNVRMPDLRFFFEEDRRLDLIQVYYSTEQAFGWMKRVVGAELRAPLTLRLHVGNNGVSNAAFYDHSVVYLGTGDGLAYKDLTRDPSVIIHECIHALIDAYAGLPSQGEGGSYNEGFADLFTALILRNPRLGESSFLGGPYRRTVENELKAYADFASGVYRNGSVIAGTFWAMKPLLGEEKLGKLAFRTLTRLGRGGTFADFLPALTHAASGLLSATEAEQVLGIARDRGWVALQ